MSTTFHGKEKIGVELFGTIPKEAAVDCAGGGLSVHATDGQVPVKVMALSLVDVHADALGFIKLSYVEVLWQVAVLIRDKPAWLVFQVDVDTGLARFLTKFLMSYPSRAGATAIKDSPRSVDLVVNNEGKNLLARCELHTGTPSRNVDKRRMLTRHGSMFYEIPWDHDAANSRVAIAVKVSVQDLAEETFGHGVAWDEEGILWKDRPHGCGRAELVPVV